MRLRVVLDSKVLVSTLLGQGGPRRLLLHLSREHVIVSSVQMLAELEDVLHRDKFQITERQIGDYISLIISGSTVLDIADYPEVIRADPDDDVVLASALEGDADYIVTGDKHLLLLREYHKTKIITVKQMLALIEN
jgi:putative PIN family toxin of toxin-antitoxin system